LIDWLIDWCLTPTLAVFQVYRGVETNDTSFMGNKNTYITYDWPTAKCW
jgi:hypothetical protein